MKLHSINSAYTLVQTLYGLTPNPTDFEDIAIHAWELINTKHTRLYRYKADTVDKKLELPCNVDIIESVHLPIADAQMTSSKTIFNSIETLFIEGYIEIWKRLNDPLYEFGKLAKYQEENNTLYFSRDYNNIVVVYRGIIVDDEDGLPLVTDKELHAIASYIAYALTLRNVMINKDPNGANLLQLLKAEWLRSCNAARIPDQLSQNDMNSILDVKYRWDRKIYGKSYKPIL